jgi:hypothetical protein
MRIRLPGRTSLAFILKPAGQLFTPGSINESWRRLLLPARRRSNALKKEAGILDNAGLPKTHGASTRGCLLSHRLNLSDGLPPRQSAIYRRARN